MTPPKKILLTGARGRLAACIRPHLADAEHELVLLSRTETSEYLSLETLFLTPLIDQSDVLLHLGWSTLPALSELNIGIEWERDLPFLIRLLRRIADSPARKRLHFVFFSSGGTVYGQAKGRPAREDDACHPIGWHGQAKRAGEEIVEAFAERHGVSCTILRISNPYGFAVPSHRAQGIIPHAFECARTGRPLSLWGDGSARKDFLHYTDFNRALQQVIDRRLTGTFNLCAGESYSVRDVIGRIEQVSGHRIPLEPGPARPWDVHDSCLSNEKLRAASGWTPSVSIEEGLQLTARELPH